MNRLQQLFKHKHKTKSKILITILTLLLIITIMPQSAYAGYIAEFEDKSQYNSNGTQGSDLTVGGGGWNPSVQNVHQATDSWYWFGYRMYMVDDKGYLVGDGTTYYVIDLAGDHMFSNDSVTKGTTLRVNKGNVKLDSIPTGTLKALNQVSGKVGSIPYPLVSGDKVNGNAVRAWMDTQNTNTDAYGNSMEYNVNWLVYALWGQDALKTYKEHDNYYLVVETLYESYLWTGYKTMEENKGGYYYESITEEYYTYTHLYYYVDYTRCVDGANHMIDICCHGKDANGDTMYECLKCHRRLTDSGSGDAVVYGLSEMLNLINSDYRSTLHNYPKKNTYTKEVGKKLVLDFNHDASCTKCTGLYTCGVLTSTSNNNNLKECTNKLYWDTYYGWLQYSASNPTITSDITGETRSVMPYSTRYLAKGGNALTLSTNDLDLGLTKAGNNCSDLTASTLGSAGYGLHLYKSSQYNVSNPIHTKNPVDPTPADPNDPITPEKPEKTTSPSFDNTGNCTIIKVYGDIYKDDYGTVHHIKDVKTYSQSQTTDWLIVEDEPAYKLQGWVVCDASPDANYTATKWLTDSSNKYVGIDKGFDKLWLFKSSSSGYKKTYTEQDNFHIGEDNTIYLLYLKSLPYIKTTDKKVPDNQTSYEPTNPTYPENPYNPNNKDKQGTFTIIKLYALLDEYNGAPLSYEVYTQKQTTPFIKIQTESNWTLAQWYTTDKTNQSVTANDFLQKASTNDQLKQFYEKGFHLKTPSPSTIGNIKSKGAIATTKYFNDGSDTVYLIFTRTKGAVNYNATEQLITESYLAKRFSTSGYWDVHNNFHPDNLKLTVTTSSGTIQEDFRNHLFTVVNPALSGGTWVDKDISFQVLGITDTNGNILSAISAVYSASESNGSYVTPAPYSKGYSRNSFDTEAALFSDLEYRFTAYRKDDNVTLADWKNNDMRDNYTNSANAIRNATNNYFVLGNTASHMGWLFFFCLKLDI